MGRLHLFELHDLPWCPALLRTTLTDLLGMGIRALRIYDPIVPLLAQLIGDRGRVLDLCSGSGGAWPDLHAQVERELGREVEVRLSDLYPAVESLEAIARVSPRIGFSRDPVDATDAPSDAAPVRTLFTSFHHFRPEQAREILRDAASKRVAIGVFEGNQRRPLALFVFMAIPAAVWVMTPFLRPWRWDRAFWTYLVPLFPLVMWWDGEVSNLRAYSPRELEALAASTGVEGYRWEAGRTRATWRQPSVTYLLGRPA